MLMSEREDIGSGDNGWFLYFAVILDNDPSS
jgi:hypothetical protein